MFSKKLFDHCVVSRVCEWPVVSKWKEWQYLRFSSSRAMNFCQKVRQWTRSIIWRLWDIYLKQLIKNEKKCGQTTHGFYTTITLSHNALLFREVFTKHAMNTIQQPPNSLDFLRDFFLFNQGKSHYGERISAVKKR